MKPACAFLPNKLRRVFASNSPSNGWLVCGPINQRATQRAKDVSKRVNIGTIALLKDKTLKNHIYALVYYQAYLYDF